MIATLRPLTYNDLLEMPDDGQRYEIIAVSPDTEGRFASRTLPGLRVDPATIFAALE